MPVCEQSFKKESRQRRGQARKRLAYRLKLRQTKSIGTHTGIIFLAKKGRRTERIVVGISVVEVVRNTMHAIASFNEMGTSNGA
jgi:hypothetical protein